MAILAAPLAGQAVDARAGIVAATQLVGGPVEVSAQASPMVEAGITMPLRDGLTLGVLAGVQPTKLRAQGRTGESLSVLQGVAELTFAAGERAFGSAGLGVASYRSERVGIFSEGADLAPLLRGGGGLRFGRLAVRAQADVTRFGTERLRAEGGSAGWVTRIGVGLGVTW